MIFVGKIKINSLKYQNDCIDPVQWAIEGNISIRGLNIGE